MCSSSLQRKVSPQFESREIFPPHLSTLPVGKFAEGKICRPASTTRTHHRVGTGCGLRTATTWEIVDMALLEKICAIQLEVDTLGCWAGPTPRLRVAAHLLSTEQNWYLSWPLLCVQLCLVALPCPCLFHLHHPILGGVLCIHKWFSHLMPQRGLSRSLINSQCCPRGLVHFEVPT